MAIQSQKTLSYSPLCVSKSYLTKNIRYNFLDANKFCVEVNTKGGEPDVDGRIILSWIFRKWDLGVLTGLSWLRLRTGGGRL
jgi:hypothetical protein